MHTLHDRPNELVSNNYKHTMSTSIAKSFLPSIPNGVKRRLAPTDLFVAVKNTGTPPYYTIDDPNYPTVGNTVWKQCRISIHKDGSVIVNIPDDNNLGLGFASIVAL
jgi:hypothetical protein